MLNGMVMNGMNMTGVRIGFGSLDDWSGDWSWSEDDWSYWSDDWSWDSQDWWSAEQPNASASFRFEKHCECPAGSHQE